MNQELQLKLQAYLDGELPASDAREVTVLLAQDADARALVAELRNTGAALDGFEAGIKLPETREFFWSKIERQIQHLERSQPAGPRESFLHAWRRFLLPAGAVAALVIAGFMAFKGVGPTADGVKVETMFADVGALTYRDQAHGVTLIWLPYPADNGVAETNSKGELD